MIDFYKDGDISFEDEIEVTRKSLNEKIENMKIKILLSDKYDTYDAIITINSGAGGMESFDFVDMLFRMYEKWANKNNFKIEILDYLSEDVGFKNITFQITGEYIYGKLKTENGVHRLVRISPFDSNAKRHTTFAAVGVSPIINQDSQVDIRVDDIEIDTYRSSGAGGQHVNTTNSAVRIRHKETGIVVTCQNERSQIQNKEHALKILKSKLIQLEMQNRENELKDLKGKEEKIEWGSQIRSYIMQPYEMVKDHRNKYEESNAKSVLDGNIDNFILQALKSWPNLSDSKKS